MRGDMGRGGYGANKVSRFCVMLVKLLGLNMLTLLFSIPVITIGASLTAMYDILLKLFRGDEEPFAKRFVASFRENFKQSTLLWLPFLLIFGAAAVDVFILITAPDALSVWVAVPAFAGAIAAYLLFQFVMPLQSHFFNTYLGTLRSAAILTVSNLPKTILMALLWALPSVLFWKFTPAFPLVVMFGYSVPGYFCVRLYEPIFQILEENAAGRPIHHTNTTSKSKIRSIE